MTTFPAIRHRRLRTTPWLRDLVAETHLAPSHFILPLFICENENARTTQNGSGIKRYSIDETKNVLEKAANLGIKAVMLFPVIDPSLKDNQGSVALHDDNLIMRALRALSLENFPLSLCVDVALDPYTSHGHDGILKDTHSKSGMIIDNDQTVDTLKTLSLHLAAAGADALCPSDMMDGRIGAIRSILEENHFDHMVLISYAAKYASCFYGPFRNLVGAQGLKGICDKKTYQMDVRNGKEALSEILFDRNEGADMIIVKPGLPYLDIIARASDIVHTPILAYHVSGEYAMIKTAAAQGLLDEKAAFLETAIAFKRAGAQSIISYAAMELAEWVKS